MVTGTGSVGRWIVRASPTWSVATLLLAFAVVPWTDRYVFGDSNFQLLPARLDWGLLFVLVMLTLSGFSRSLAEVASEDSAVALTGMRRALRDSVSGLALWISLLPMLLLYQTLRLTEIATQQDAVLGFSIWGFELGFPAWGLILNPVAALLFWVSAMIHAGLPPFEVSRVEEELAGGRVSRIPAPGSGSLALADTLRALLIAVVATVVFLGAGDLPWVSQTSLTVFIESYFGSSVGRFLSLMIHLLSFVLKVTLVFSAQRAFSQSFGRVRFEPILSLCWKGLVPLALLNCVATAIVVAWRLKEGA